MSSPRSPDVGSYARATTRTVTAGGVTCAHRSLGPVGGVPIVFLVHLGANLDNWDPRVIDPVAAHRHVVTVDNRGLGASTGRVPDTVEKMADDAAAFIRSLGSGPVDVVGLSLGGMVAQALVERQPALVRRLVLAGTGPRGGAGIDRIARITYVDMLRAGLTRSDPKEFLFFDRDAVGRRAAREFVGRLQERTDDRDAPLTLRALRTQLAAVVRWGQGVPADLGRIGVPTPILHGDHDRMVPSVLAADLHRRIPGSELEVWPGGGHGAVFQFHDRFTARVLEFLGR